MEVHSVPQEVSSVTEGSNIANQATSGCGGNVSGAVVKVGDGEKVLPRDDVSICTVPMDPNNNSNRSSQNVAHKLFVGMLGKTTSEEEFRTLFKGFGTITDCVILHHKDGSSKGCGFITYSTSEEASVAIAKMHESCVMSGCTRSLIVKLADNKTGGQGSSGNYISENEDSKEKNSTIFIGMLSKQLNEPEVRAMFCKFGEIKNCHVLRDSNGSSRSCAFVTFSDHNEALLAIKEMNGSIKMTGCSSNIVVKIANPKVGAATSSNQFANAEQHDDVSNAEKKLFVGMLSKEFTEDKVRSMFEKYGEITDCAVLRDREGNSKGCAFVTFLNSNDAHSAIGGLNRSVKFPGASRSLVVKFADTGNSRNEQVIGFGGQAGPGASLPLSGSSERHLAPGDLLSQARLFNAYVQSLMSYGSAPSGGMPYHYGERSNANANNSNNYYNNSVTPLQNAAMRTAPSSNTSTNSAPYFTRPPTGQTFNNQQQQQAMTSPTPGATAGTFASSLQYHPKTPTDNSSGMMASGIQGQGQIPVYGQGHGYNQAPVDTFKPPVPSLPDYFSAAYQQHFINQQRNSTPQQQSFMQQAYQQQATPSLSLNQQRIESNTNNNTNNAGVGSSTSSTAGQLSGPARQQTGPAGANLFVYHIPQEYGDQELAALFMPYGHVISSKVFVDRETNRSKCFGFVSYDSAQSAGVAVTSLNGLHLSGKRLKVELKKPRKPY